MGSLAPQHKLKSHFLSGKTSSSSWCQREGSFNKSQNRRGWKGLLGITKTNSQMETDIEIFEIKSQGKIYY